MIAESELHALHSRAAAELEAAARELAEAQQRMSDAEARVKLLEDLLALEGGGHSTTSPASEVASVDVVDATVAILEARGVPTSLADLRGALLERGVPLPGKGEPANLIARFQRSGGRIIRVGRGMYDLDRRVTQGWLEYPDGRRVDLQPVTRLGRSDQCEIVLSDPAVALTHALITVHEHSAVVGDAGGDEIVFVNEQPLEHPARLKNGDRIRVGDTVLVYRAG